uniref:BAH domain-containing protein n=1 Tax=Triticum urartu TaxID=4572 RepID=A0A8R7QKG9_TRIUA
MVGKTPDGEALYRSVRVGDLSIVVGGAVTLEGDSGEAIMCFVEYMYETHGGTQMIHGRVLQNGSHTVLGKAGNERELFFTNDCLVQFKVGDMRGSVTVNFRLIPWGYNCRKDQLEAIRVEKANAEDRKKKGLPVGYIHKSLYCPEKGAFFSLPHEKMGNGTGTCSSCEERVAVEDELKILSETNFVLKNVTYNVHDFLYIMPEFFPRVEGRGTYGLEEMWA